MNKKTRKHQQANRKVRNWLRRKDIRAGLAQKDYTTPRGLNK